jgi:uncharacterized protein
MYQCDCGDCNSSPDLLTAWLHVTDRCNFRCAYCYLPHEQVDMPFSTGKAVADATLRAAQLHGYAKVFLKYAGGEPLLRFPFIQQLHRHANMQGDAAGIAVSGSILSNGSLLTRETVEGIRALDLHLVISIDGIGKCHDRQRRYADGTGSCADVINAVELATAHGLIPYLSVVITEQNADDLPDLISWALDHDLPFNLSIARSGGQFQTQPRSQERILHGMLLAYTVIEKKLPRRSLLTSLTDNANLATQHLHPCGAGKNYMAFDCHGKIAKCQMEYGKPVTDCNAPDPLSELQRSAHGIQNVSVEEKEECACCEWKYWCAGGCPLSAFRSVGRYDAKSPNCAIYKTLYPEVFRLEQLRLERCAAA